MASPLKKHLYTDKIVPDGVRISSSAQARPATMAGFAIYLENPDTQMATKIKPFRDVKLNTTGKNWFVEFKHMIPSELRKQYQNRKWLRIRVYKGINVVKTLEYANELKKSVIDWLNQGYSPFEWSAEAIELASDEKQKQWTAQQAILYFIQKWEEKNLASSSMVKYKKTANRFIDWLEKTNLSHTDASELTGQHIEACLNYYQKKDKWSNTTYNGERGFLGTIFTFLDKKKIVSKPEQPEKLKATTKKHRYYDDRTYERLKKVLEKKDPYLLFACQVVYYMCLRSEKELKNLKVGNIFPESKQALITIGKTGGRYIPLSDEVIKIFEERSILSYPADYYVFGVPSKTKFIREGTPGDKPFGNGFFSKRFSKIRKDAKLSADFTLYGMKHTRIIHLKHDGARDSDIMSLTGHKTYEAYSSYLRDLGVTADPKELQKHTRKI